MCIQKLQPLQRTQGLFLPSVGRYSWRQMLQRFSSFSTKFCRHFFFLYLLDSDCLTSLLFYSQSFLHLSSSCQLFPFFFSLCFISLPIVSCISLPSYFPFLVTSFAFLQVVLLFLVSHQVKFPLTQGHAQIWNTSFDAFTFWRTACLKSGKG